MKRKILSFTILSILALSSISSYADKANINKSYIKGYSETKFKPEYNVKRSELSAMIARKLEYKEETANYTDVKDNATHWAAGSIGALSSRKILTGYSDGTFRPENNITRGELAQILNNAYEVSTNKKLSTNSTNLSDIQNHWAKQSIMNMETIGILKGHNDGKFKPDDYLTREEAVASINRFSRILENRGSREKQFMYKVKNKFEDVDFIRWSYNDILEASTDYQFNRSGDTEFLVKTLDPNMEYAVDFQNDSIDNSKVLKELLNFKRKTQGIPELADDNKLDELAKGVSKADAKNLSKDSLTEADIKNMRDTIGITDKLAPQKGSLLFRTRDMNKRFATDILDDTLFATQFFRSFDRIGIANMKSGDKSYNSLVIYLGLNQSSTAIDHIVDKDEAVEIFKRLK